MKWYKESNHGFQATHILGHHASSGGYPAKRLESTSQPTYRLSVYRWNSINCNPTIGLLQLSFVHNNDG